MFKSKDAVAEVTEAVAPVELAQEDDDGEGPGEGEAPELEAMWDEGALVALLRELQLDTQPVEVDTTYVVLPNAI